MSQDKLKKCLEEGKSGGERHQGLREVEPDSLRANGHIRKALHNFEAISDFHNKGYSDWSASAAFYTLYHGLLAILAQQGYESRNQSCTFAMIEDLINKNKITNLKLADVRSIFDKDISSDLAHSSKILDIRERMQYSTTTSLEEEEFQLLKNNTQKLLIKIRLELEKIK